MGNCSSCNGEVAPGTRWCPICGSNVLNPAIGRLARPASRLRAFFLGVLVQILVLLLISVAAYLMTVGNGSRAGSGLVVLLVGLALLAAYVIWALILFGRGTTPAKKLLGMRVIKKDGREARFVTMLIREWVAKWVSGLPLGLGFLWILFDRHKQGWHDKLMGTYVVR